MSEEHVKRKIDGFRQDPRYTQVLRLGRLPPAAPQQEQQQPPQLPASAPAPEPSPSTSAGSPEEDSRHAAGQKVLDATLKVLKKVHGKEPPLMPGLRGVDIGFNQRYGFQTMEGIICLIDYGSSNGGFVPLPTQQHGACLFHAFRRSITCPREFTNSHLRCMIVSFICNRADELYPMLECSISGNYGHIQLSPEEYRRKEASGQLTDLERQEYNEPGPFSIRFLWGGTMFKVTLHAFQGEDHYFGWRLPGRNQDLTPKCSSQCRCHPSSCQSVSLYCHG